MILTTIQSKLTTLSTTQQKELSILIGYYSFKRFKKRLEFLLSCHSMKAYLDRSYYDFTHDSKSFLYALANKIDVSLTELESATEEYEQLYKEMNKIAKGYIFVDTNFKRKNEPIATLGMFEYQRRLPLNTQTLAFKPLDVQLDFISKTIVEHYQKSDNGKLGIWGTIEHYIVHLEESIFIFSKEGKLQVSTPTTPLAESMATIRIA